MYQCISNADFETAYEVACLGVPDQDWRSLAAEALAALEFDVALKASVRTRDIRRIELISSFIKGGGHALSAKINAVEILSLCSNWR